MDRLGAIWICGVGIMAHNGGLSQINLPPTNFGQDHPFKDYIKNADGWQPIGGQIFDPDLHDADGWMHTTYPGSNGVQAVTFGPSQTDRPGNYVLRWDNGGSLNLGFSKTIISGSGSGTNGRIEFSTTETRWVVQVVGVTAPGSDYPKNVRLCHVDDETALEAAMVYIRLGQVPPGDLFFGTKFLQRLLEANFGAVRHVLTSGNVTGAVVNTWANRTRHTYWSFAGMFFNKAVYAGVTANTGNDYTVAAPPGFVLAHDATVQVKWNFTATSGTSSLDVGSSGAKPIYDSVLNWDPDTGLYGTSGAIPELYPTINKISFLRYDADLGAWYKQGGDTSGSAGTMFGWPYEYMIELSNTLGADCSIPIPHIALDRITDLPLSLVTYADANLDAGLKIQLEGPNEEWNPIFLSYRYAQGKESDGSVHQWYGRAVAKMGKIVHDYFSGDTTRYDVIAGVQTYGNITDQLPRYTSPRYVTETGNPALSAKYFITRLDPTVYYNVSQHGTSVETTAADDWLAAATTAEKEAIRHTYMSDESGPGNSLIDQLDSWQLALDNVNGGGVSIKLGSYEGGFSPDYSSFGGTSTVDQFRRYCKDWPGQYKLLTQYYYHLVYHLGGTQPSCFQLSTGGQAWSVLDPSVFITDDPPQWRAIREFNNNQKTLTVTVTAAIDPVINGTNYRGSVLAGADGTYSGTPSSLIYQWKRSGVNIAGATSANYTLVLADEGSTITRSETATVNGVVLSPKVSNAISVPVLSTEAYNFLQRVTGLDLTHSSMYINLINGLVSDGVWSSLDALYFTATDTEVHAKLNLIGTSYPLTKTGSISFLADQGFSIVADSASDYITTGFNPSTAGGLYTLNSAHLAVGNEVNAGSNTSRMGAHNSNNPAALLYVKFGGNTDQARINTNSFGGTSYTDTNAIGRFIGSRTASNLSKQYKNGVEVASSTDASSSLVNLEFLFGGANLTGTPTGAAGLYSWGSIGGGLDATKALALDTRINTARLAVGLT